METGSLGSSLVGDHWTFASIPMRGPPHRNLSSKVPMGLDVGHAIATSHVFSGPEKLRAALPQGG